MLGGLAFGVPLPAVAHPHIFIDAGVRIVFDEAGAVSAVENTWTFDEAFSMWQVQGLDTNGDGITSSEEMAELAAETMEGLAEYEFYTFAGEGEENLRFAAGGPATFTHEGGLTTLSFAVRPEAPYRIGQALELAINDPAYYVSITFKDASAVELVNAPAGCTARLQPGFDMPEDVAAELYALPPEVTELPPHLSAALRGVQGAIYVDCPGGAGAGDTSADGPATALDAATEVAEATPAGGGAVPFGGPPPEPGFVLPKTGFLGWIAEQQANFYQSMTSLLGTLRQDANAFFVLGGLSFLYGVFHAAGPGHGKVVISSYMLANERQVRRGIWLSFAAAMLQALVAIGFVLIAAAALNLSAAAMNDAAGGMGVASYALIVLLGLWLLVRHVFGMGHRHTRPHAEHGHDHHDHHDHHHGDQHDHRHHDHHGHGHAHAVTAEATGGSWREQLGVVLAVGLRPCSGALVVLAFAVSQGLIAAGVAAVLLMGLGTAITVAVLAALALWAKGLAGRLAGANGAIAGGIIWWAELGGALLVLGFGAVLLAASLGVG